MVITYGVKDIEGTKIEDKQELDLKQQRYKTTKTKEDLAGEDIPIY